MTETRKKHPAGTVAFPCHDLVRYAANTLSLSTMAMPEGSVIAMVRGVAITESLNRIFRERKGDWVWCQADDHVWPAQLLMQLLDRDVDVVVPLITTRIPPYQLVIFKGIDEKGEHIYHKPSDLPPSGLFPVFAAGTAGMLVRSHVLEAIGDPWMENSEANVTDDDFVFSRKIRDAGFTIYADVEASMGHVGHVVTLPAQHEGTWGITLDLGGIGVNRIWMPDNSANEPTPEA